ncbi:GLUG motif-containing protein [Natronobacterium gregoryi]|uniref:GLUG domain-containing protein n=2 Tax=Natronobacterium gregoryi TaxID=44930 RepID=L0AN92_NATGS|nr:GLUG motif-containing protein [Natronobacterium gregoryi]AFZ74652.1 GLUG motif-containing protein [Natronobacterium gregoryi SP2]ELY72534.1 GLUG domain-containing protein [Natronobacterium gregoryi SP2]PLK19830.1 peptidase M26 [Natronobacterium gregoryi SP2]SFJ31380.1 The GLUG motif-containing protein [Natronobacterium gregoryi]
MYTSQRVKITSIVIAFLIGFSVLTFLTLSASASAEEAPEDAIEIEDVDDLQSIEDEPGEDYILTDDIDASETENWNTDTIDVTDETIGPADRQKLSTNYPIEEGTLTVYLEENGTEEVSEDEYQVNHEDGEIIFEEMPTNMDIAEYGDLTLQPSGNIAVDYTTAEEVPHGFDPIETFNGTLDGQNNSVDNLYIERADEDGVGLISTNTGEISNLTVNSQVAGGDYVGGAVGINDGDLTNVHSESHVMGNIHVGGLVGQNNESITQSSTSGGLALDVIGDTGVGGLAGHTDGDISDSHSENNVHSTNLNAGGFVGSIDNDGSVDSSMASGTVNGATSVGGFVGNIDDGSISESNSSGDVTVEMSVGGGFAGGVLHGTISDSYTTSDVYTEGGGLTGADGVETGIDGIGGFIGVAQSDNGVTDSYTAGEVTIGDNDSGGTFAGGVEKGSETTAIENSYYNAETADEELSEVGSSEGELEENEVTGLSEGEMTGDNAEEHMELDFEDTWYTGDAYALLSDDIHDVELTVINNGDPVEDAEVEIIQGEEIVTESETDEDGLAVTSVQESAYTVSVEHGEDEITENIVVDDDTSATLEFTSEAGGGGGAGDDGIPLVLVGIVIAVITVLAGVIGLIVFASRQ